MKKNIFYKILLICSSMILCLCVGVEFLFAWFVNKNENIIVKTGAGNLEVNFYRLRDSNWDGVYDFSDFSYDYYHQDEIEDFTFSDFQNDIVTSYIQGTGDTFDSSLDFNNSEKIKQGLEFLSKEKILKYTYTQSFQQLVEQVLAGCRVNYILCVKNKSERSVRADISFSDLLSYYKNKSQMLYYKENGKIKIDLPDDENDIEEYAAKFLFSIDIGEKDTIPLFNYQSQEVFMSQLLAPIDQENSSYDFNFSIVYDAKTAQSDYKDSILSQESLVYQDCLKQAKKLGYDEDFVSSYLKAMTEEEMNFLFTDKGEANINNLKLMIKYIQVMGTVQ